MTDAADGIESQARPAPGWSHATVLAGALLVAVVSGVLHWQAGFTYPRPWPDESHFITPALTLAQHGRLAVPELNAPDGIFWVPTGYYVVQLPLLWAGVDPVVAGRLLSLAGMLLFAAGLGAAARRAGVRAVVVLGAITVWVAMPRVVAMANIARMEGVVLGLAGATVWLAARGRWRLALAAGLLAPLVHPVGVVVAVAAAAAGLVAGRKQRRAWTWGERLALGVVAALWAAEIAYFLASGDVAAEHLRFQLTRKAGRPIVWQWWQVALLLAAGAGGLAATWRWWRRAGPLTGMWICIALAGGFVLVDVVGREMWYQALGRETGALLLGLATAAALRREGIPRAGLPPAIERMVVVVLGAALLAGGALAARATLTGGWYSMRPDSASTRDWRVFTDRALAELERLDAGQSQPATVVIDPLSGFGQEVVGQSFDQLSFVQPTPVTPLDTRAADFVLATPGAPFTTKALVAQWGAVPPAVEVTSPQGTFTLQVFANPS